MASLRVQGWINSWGFDAIHKPLRVYDCSWVFEWNTALCLLQGYLLCSMLFKRILMLILMLCFSIVFPQPLTQDVPFSLNMSPQLFSRERENLNRDIALLMPQITYSTNSQSFNIHSWSKGSNFIWKWRFRVF